MHSSGLTRVVFSVECPLQGAVLSERLSIIIAIWIVLKHSSPSHVSCPVLRNDRYGAIIPQWRHPVNGTVSVDCVNQLANELSSVCHRAWSRRTSAVLSTDDEVIARDREKIYSLFADARRRLCN